MAETAAHLVEQVIPHVPVRQWVVSFPIPLRHLFATQPHLLSPINVSQYLQVGMRDEMGVGLSLHIDKVRDYCIVCLFMVLLEF